MNLNSRSIDVVTETKHPIALRHYSSNQIWPYDPHWQIVQSLVSLPSLVWLPSMSSVSTRQSHYIDIPFQLISSKPADSGIVALGFIMKLCGLTYNFNDFYQIKRLLITLNISTISENPRSREDAYALYQHKLGRFFDIEMITTHLPVDRRTIAEYVNENCLLVVPYRALNVKPVLENGEINWAIIVGYIDSNYLEYDSEVRIILRHTSGNVPHICDLSKLSQSNASLPDDVIPNLEFCQDNLERHQIGNSYFILRPIKNNNYSCQSNLEDNDFETQRNNMIRILAAMKETPETNVDDREFMENNDEEEQELFEGIEPPKETTEKADRSGIVKCGIDYYCKICKIKIDNVLLNDHLSGFKHKNNIIIAEMQHHWSSNSPNNETSEYSSSTVAANENSKSVRQIEDNEMEQHPIQLCHYYSDEVQLHKELIAKNFNPAVSWSSVPFSHTRQSHYISIPFQIKGRKKVKSSSKHADSCLLALLQIMTGCELFYDLFQLKQLLILLNLSQFDQLRSRESAYALYRHKLGQYFDVEMITIPLPVDRRTIARYIDTNCLLVVPFLELNGKPVLENGEINWAIIVGYIDSYLESDNFDLQIIVRRVDQKQTLICQLSELSKSNAALPDDIIPNLEECRNHHDFGKMYFILRPTMKKMNCLTNSEDNGSDEKFSRILATMEEQYREKVQNPQLRYIHLYRNQERWTTYYIESVNELWDNLGKPKQGWLTIYRRNQKFNEIQYIYIQLPHCVKIQQFRGIATLGMMMRTCFILHHFPLLRYEMSFKNICHTDGDFRSREDMLEFFKAKLYKFYDTVMITGQRLPNLLYYYKTAINSNNLIIVPYLAHPKSWKPTTDKSIGKLNFAIIVGFIPLNPLKEEDFWLIIRHCDPKPLLFRLNQLIDSNASLGAYRVENLDECSDQKERFYFGMSYYVLHPRPFDWVMSDAERMEDESYRINEQMVMKLYLDVNRLDPNRILDLKKHLHEHEQSSSKMTEENIRMMLNSKLDESRMNDCVQFLSTITLS